MDWLNLPKVEGTDTIIRHDAMVVEETIKDLSNPQSPYKTSRLSRDDRIGWQEGVNAFNALGAAPSKAILSKSMVDIIQRGYEYRGVAAEMVGRIEIADSVWDQGMAKNVLATDGASIATTVNTSYDEGQIVDLTSLVKVKDSGASDVTDNYWYAISSDPEILNIGSDNKLYCRRPGYVKVTFTYLQNKTINKTIGITVKNKNQWTQIR